MPLHPEIAKVLPHLPPPAFPLDPVAMRAADEEHVPPLEERLSIASVSDDVAGGVPVRLYRDGGEEPEGALVYVHGGAFFLGSLNTHDHICRSLAKATGLTVVAVDYRLAPENPFPSGLEDCWTVLTWAAGQGFGPTLALAGDSSGGTFAAALAARAHDEGVAVTHQVLYYPSLDLDFDAALSSGRYPSLVENAVGYGLETAGLKPFNAFYVESGADPADPCVSPIKRADVSGLAPSLIVTGEYDPLRDEAELYGKRLQEAGVDVIVTRYGGAGHGFVQHFSWLPEYAEVFKETAAFLKGTKA